MIEKYSYSGFSTYQTCPYQYKKLYVDKVAIAPNKWACRGITCADAIEHMFKEYDPKRQITKEYIAEKVKQFWVPNQYKKEYEESQGPSYMYLGYKNEKDEEAMFNEICNNLYLYFSHRGVKTPFASELKFLVPWKDIQFSGRMDVIHKEGNFLDLVDYKYTNSYLNDLTDSIQLCIYIHSILYMFPRYQIRNVGYGYLKQGKDCLVPLSNINLEKGFQKIESCLEGIRDKRFERCSSYLCKYCQFYLECANDE